MRSSARRSRALERRRARDGAGARAVGADRARSSRLPSARSTSRTRGSSSSLRKGSGSTRSSRGTSDERAGSELRGASSSGSRRSSRTRSGSPPHARTRCAPSRPFGRRFSSFGSRKSASRRTSTSCARPCKRIAAGSRRSKRCKKPRSASPRSKSIAGSKRRRSTSGAAWPKTSSSRPVGREPSRRCSAPICKPSASRTSIPSRGRSPSSPKAALSLVETAGDARRTRRAPMRCSSTCKRPRPSRRCSSAFASPIR